MVQRIVFFDRTNQRYARYRRKINHRPMTRKRERLGCNGLHPQRNTDRRAQARSTKKSQRQEKQQQNKNNLCHETLVSTQSSFVPRPRSRPPYYASITFQRACGGGPETSLTLPLCQNTVNAPRYGTPDTPLHSFSLLQYNSASLNTSSVA